MTKKTKLYGIFSESPQMGKTTTHINLLKSTYADWHVFTSIFDRNVVAKDYKSKCIQAGINMQQLSADTNIKAILKERWNRGMIDQVYRYFALGNLKGIQNLLDVAYGLKEYGIPRLLSIDEADIYGDFLELFPVDNEGKPKRDTRMREIMAEGTFDHIQAITASWEDFLHSAYEFDPELNIYIQNNDFYGPLNTDWAAAGVAGMKLKKDDQIVSADVLKQGDTDREILVVMENGYGKTTPAAEYKVQSRAGSGIKTAKVTSKTGKVVGAAVLSKEDRTEGELVVMSKKGQVIKLSLKDVPSLGRDTQGVKVMKMRAGDAIASIVYF